MYTGHTIIPQGNQVFIIVLCALEQEVRNLKRYKKIRYTNRSCLKTNNNNNNLQGK